MSSRELAFFVVMLTLLFVFTLVSNIGVFGFLIFQLVLAIVVYLNYPSAINVFGLFLVLFIFDAGLGTNPATSILSFGISGFVVSIISKFIPIFKQRPFIIGRMLWLFFSLIAYHLLLNGVENVQDLIGNLFKSFVISILVMAIITYFFEPFLARKAARDIIIN